MTTKALWCASLSDGTTHFEGSGDFTEIPGGESPYLRLLSFVSANGLKITSLGLLNSEHGRHWHLPSVGRNPKFRAFDSCPKPSECRFFRMMGVDKKGKDAERVDLFSVIEATYQDGVRVQVWVEDGTLNSWTVRA